METNCSVWPGISSHSCTFYIQLEEFAAAGSCWPKIANNCSSKNCEATGKTRLERTNQWNELVSGCNSCQEYWRIFLTETDNVDRCMMKLRKWISYERKLQRNTCFTEYKLKIVRIWKPIYLLDSLVADCRIAAETKKTRWTFYYCNLNCSPSWLTILRHTVDTRHKAFVWSDWWLVWWWHKFFTKL